MATPKNHVILLIKAANCSACIQLDRNWGNIETGIKKKYPHLRFITIQFPDKAKPQIDTTVYPAGIKDFCGLNKWLPMIVLIPTELWNLAIENINLGNDIKLADMAVVLNGFKEKAPDNPNITHLSYRPVYNPTILQNDGRNKGILDWIDDNITSPQFIAPIDKNAYQATSDSSIRPLMTSSIPQVATRTTSNQKPPIINRQLGYTQITGGSKSGINVCTMNILPRKTG